MDFLVYHRDRPGSMPLREAMVEEHWAYMDRFADELVARGPVVAGDELLGSVHVVDLPDAASAWRFAFEEPCYQAGAYRDVMVRRWRNLLGRDMWAFPRREHPADRFLVIGLGSGADEDVPPTDRDSLIAYGSLLSDDGSTWLGTAAIVEAGSSDTARLIMDESRYDSIEVHEWTFGGRR